MAKIDTVCVFCGASEGINPAFVASARTLGNAIGENRTRLIYGGARIGMMGSVARAAMDAGSHVTGIIPGHIHDIEPSMEDVSKLVLVDTMHERKMMMFQEADAFISLPGGIGTLDETIELLTWRQLGLHSKPVVLVNVEEFWAPLLALIDHLIDGKFTPRAIRSILHVVSSAEEVMPLLRSLPEPEERPVAIAYDR